MTNLNHTQLLDPPIDMSDPGNADRLTPAMLQAAKPHFVEQAEARWYGNSLWEFLLPEEATGGRLSVFQATVPQGFSPPRHIHTREDEVFLILDGEVEFDLDGERRLAGSGAAVYMPRGVPHTFRVNSPTARMLGVMTPGAFEQLFRNLSVPDDARAGNRPLRHLRGDGGADSARYPGNRTADGCHRRVGRRSREQADPRSGSYCRKMDCLEP